MNALDGLALHGACNPAGCLPAHASDPMRLAMLTAHMRGGRSDLFPGVSRSTVRALARRGMAEPIHEEGRSDLRKVVVGYELTLNGSREVQRIIREGNR